jgi:dUTP pyrophosphatase
MTHPDHEARLQQLNQGLKELNKVKRVDNGINEFSRKVKVKLLSENAKLPTRANLSDAGWDLYSTEDIIIYGGQRAIIKTGICMEIPDEWVGLIWPRSGLSVKKGLDVLAGVVDSGYRGELKVCLLNTNKPLPLFKDELCDVKIRKGDRIAQILFQRVPDIHLIEVENISDSDRGENGFGSSGK